MQMIRWGVIGAGNMGKTFAHSIKEVDNAETKAINESLDKIKKPKGKKEQKLEKDQQTRQNLENEQPKTKKDAEEIRQYFDEGFEQDFKNLDEKIEAWRKGAINPKTNEAYKLGEVLNETFASGQWARNSTDGSIVVLNKVFEKFNFIDKSWSLSLIYFSKIKRKDLKYFQC